MRIFGSWIQIRIRICIRVKNWIRIWILIRIKKNSEALVVQNGAVEGL
jgi:hypothetical protein